MLTVSWWMCLVIFLFRKQINWMTAENPVTYPKFDDDAEIYPKLIDTLNAALEDLQAADGGPLTASC